MTLTKKEYMLLEDLKSHELLCIEKYGKYAEMAHDPALAEIFNQVKTTEEEHLKTIGEMMNGTEVPMSQESPSATAAKVECKPSSAGPDEKSEDVYLCRDALSMEKHVSATYNTCIFEFTSPVMRDTLAHIQKEEQNHGEMFYNYLAANGESA